MIQNLLLFRAETRAFCIICRRLNGNYVASDSSVFAAKTASSDNLCMGGGFRYSPIRIVGVDIPMQAEIL